MREFSEILTDLRAAFSELTESEKAISAESIVGKNAMSGFLALMNAGEADVQKLSDAIANCDGMAASMAETMQDNLQGAVTTFNSALEGVQIAVYDKFKDGCTEAVNIFTDAMNDISARVEIGSALGESFENLGESFADAAREIALMVKEDLPDFIDTLAKAVTFVIEFREEIGAAVAGFAAFKGAMAVGNIVTAAISSFKALAATIKGAAAAQEGFNIAAAANPYGLIAAGIGIAVGAVVEFTSHTKSATEQILELRQASDEAAASAEKFADKAKSLDEIKKEYENVTNSAEDTADKTERLTALQDDLIAQFPELKGQIDLVTGAYEDMSAALSHASQMAKESALYDAKQALEQAQSAVDKTRDRYIEADSRLFPRGFGSETEKKFGSDKVAYYGTSNKLYIETDDLEERREIVESLYEELRSAGAEYLQTDFAQSLRNEVAEIDRLIADYEKKKEQFDRIEAIAQGKAEAQTPTEAKTPAEAQTPAQTTAKTKTTDEDAYNEQKKLLDAKHNAGYLSEQEYYNQLKALRDKYLQEDTLAWYNSTAALNSIYDKWTSAATKSASAVKSSLDEVQMAYKRTLEAIDAEIERHNREKSDLEFQAQIDAIDEKLVYGRLDDFSKYELEKERARLVEEHDEELYSRQAEDAKTVVTNAYNAQQTLKNADYGTEEYTLAIGDYAEKLEGLTEALSGIMGVQNNSATNNTSIDESTKNQFVNVVLQAANRSNEQLIDELIKALHSGI